MRAFGGEAACEAKFAEITDELYTTGLKSVFYSSVTNPGTRFVNAVVYAAVGVFGAVSAIGGGITVGQLSSFLTYANQYTKPFNEVTGVLTQMQTALASAARLLELIDQAPETPDAPGALAPAACAGRVDVENVSFFLCEGRAAYPEFHAACAARPARGHCGAHGLRQNHADQPADALL